MTQRPSPTRAALTCSPHHPSQALLLLLQTLRPYYNSLMLCFDVLPNVLPGPSFLAPFVYSFFPFLCVSSGLAPCFSFLYLSSSENFQILSEAWAIPPLLFYIYGLLLPPPIFFRSFKTSPYIIFSPTVKHPNPSPPCLILQNTMVASSWFSGL